MRLVKLGIISVVGLFLVILIISLLIPSNARVSRAITINQPIDTVSKYVKDMREWKKWNVLLQNPVLTNVSYSADKFISSDMSVTIVSRDSNLVVSQWQRQSQEPVSSGIFLASSGANVTIVNAYFDFKVKWYPWEKFGSIVFDKEMGPPLEKSLDDLKILCEKTN